MEEVGVEVEVLVEVEVVAVVEVVVMVVEEEGWLFYGN